MVGFAIAGALAAALVSSASGAGGQGSENNSQKLPYGWAKLPKGWTLDPNKPGVVGPPAGLGSLPAWQAAKRAANARAGLPPPPAPNSTQQSAADGSSGDGSSVQDAEQPPSSG